MSLPRLMLAAGAVALTACSLNSDLPTSRPLGIVLITDTTVNNQFALAPVAHFFHAENVTPPDSHVAQDSCLVLPYLADTGTFPYGAYTGIDAGSAITVQTTSAATSVPEDLTGGDVGTYRLPGDSTIPFSPGTAVTVTVPGVDKGFPSFAVSAATAAPYTFAPIDTAPAVDSFHVSWSPAAGAGSAMVFALDFIEPDTTGNNGAPAHVEIYCSEQDTGDALIPRGVTTAWLRALPGTRAIRSYRWQTTFQNADSAGFEIIAQHNENPAFFPGLEPR